MGSPVAGLTISPEDFLKGSGQLTLSPEEFLKTPVSGKSNTLPPVPGSALLSPARASVKPIGDVQILEEEPAATPSMISTRDVYKQVPGKPFEYEGGGVRRKVVAGPNEPSQNVLEWATRPPAFVQEALEPLSVGPFVIEKKLLEPMATPLGVALSGFGYGQAALTQWLPVLARPVSALDAAIALYFAYEGAKGAKEAGPAAVEAWKKGDYQGVFDAVGDAALGSIMALAGGIGGTIKGVEAVRRGPKPPPPGPPPAPGATEIPPVPEIPKVEAPRAALSERPISGETWREAQARRRREPSPPAEPPSEPLVADLPVAAVAPQPPSPPGTIPPVPGVEQAAPVRAGEVFTNEIGRYESLGMEGRNMKFRITDSQGRTSEQVTPISNWNALKVSTEKATPPVPKVDPPLQPPEVGGTVPKQEPPNVAGEAGQGAGRPDVRGAGGVLPQLPEPRGPSGEVRRGKETSISIPESNEVQRAHYELRELDDVAPSHNGITFHPNPRYWYKNERNYGSPEYQASTVERAQNFNPSKLINDSPNPTSGPTIIDSNGNALGGNNRRMVLGRVYEMHPEHAEAYKAQLASDLPHYGIDPAELPKFKKPVLVRVLDEDFDPVKVIRDYNKDEASSLLVNEQALADSQRISVGTLQEMSRRLEDLPEGAGIVRALEGEDGISFLNRLIDDGVLTRGEANGLIERKQTGPVLLGAGKQRIIKLLVTRMYRGTEQMERTPSGIQGKLERALPSIAKMEGTGDWDLRPIIHNALDILEESRARGLKSLEDIFRQQVMFGEEAQRQPVTLAKALRDWTPTQVQDAVAKYVKESEFKGGSVFGEVTQDAGFRAAFDEAPPNRGRKKLPTEADKGPPKLVFGGVEPSGPPTRFDMAQIGADLMMQGKTDLPNWLDAMQERFGQIENPAELYQKAKRLKEQRGVIRLDIEGREPGEIPAEEFLNFRWVNISAREKKNLERLVQEQVTESGGYPKQRIPFSEIEAEARNLGVEELKSLTRVEAGETLRPEVRLAAREALNTLNSESYRLNKDLQERGMQMAEGERMDAEKRIQAVEKDARGLIDVLYPTRSQDGRNLVYHRIMAEQAPFDVDLWLSKARRAMGLPPGTTPPEAVVGKIRELAAAGREAEGKLETELGAAGTDILGERQTKGAITEGEKQVFDAKRAVEQTARALKETEAVNDQTQEHIAKIEELRQQNEFAEQTLAESKKTLRKLREQYQTMVARREKLLVGDARVQAAQRELTTARRTLSREVATLEKTGWLKAISLLRKAGLLTGFKTHVRNLGGNTAFQAMEELSHVPAAMVDMAIELGTHQRTVQSASAKAVRRATYEAATRGVREASQIMRQGATEVDLQKMEVNRELNTGVAWPFRRTTWLDNYGNFVFRTMSAEDRVFKSFAFRRSLEEQAFLMAKNEGLGGVELATRAKDLVASPSETMTAQAIADSEFATFNNKNLLASAFRVGQGYLERRGRAGKALAFAMDWTVPFANTPANIIERLFEYTPIGAGVEIGVGVGKAIANKGLSLADQRMISLAAGRGAVGSAVMYLGWKLAENGMATGIGQQTEGQRQVNVAAGRPAGAILGPDGYWHQVAAFSPLGNLFAIGATMYQTGTQKLSREAARPGKMLAIGTRAVIEQPMLKGVSTVTQTLQEPERSGQRYISSEIGSLIPTLVSDAAALFDPYRRDSRPDTFIESFYRGAQMRTPGLRNLMPRMEDVLGRTISQSPAGAYDPTLPARAKERTDPVVAELIRNSVTIGKPNQRPNESPEEYRARSIFVGRQIEWELMDEIQSEEYANAANKDERQALLDDAVTRARSTLRSMTTGNEDYQAMSPKERILFLQKNIDLSNRDIEAARGSLPPVPAMSR